MEKSNMIKFETAYRFIDCKLCNKYTKVGLNDYVKSDEVYWKARFIDDTNPADIILREFRIEEEISLNYLDLVKVVIGLGKPDKNGRVTFVLCDVLEIIEDFAKLHDKTKKEVK